MNATDVECPVCGAVVGQRCRTVSGKALPVTHARRKYAAFSAESQKESASDSPAGATGDETEGSAS